MNSLLEVVFFVRAKRRFGFAGSMWRSMVVRMGGAGRGQSQVPTLHPTLSYRPPARGQYPIHSTDAAL